MTVKELIKELKKYDSNMQVLHYTGYYVPIENVWQDSEGVKLEDDGVQ
jgi:hypothetical protein